MKKWITSLAATLLIFCCTNGFALAQYGKVTITNTSPLTIVMTVNGAIHKEMAANGGSATVMRTLGNGDGFGSSNQVTVSNMMGQKHQYNVAISDVRTHINENVELHVYRTFLVLSTPAEDIIIQPKS